MTPKPAKYCKESRTIKASMVLPPDTNNYGTMFGGKVMYHIDDIAAIAATRHARTSVVTASTDSVDFLHPIRIGHSVCLEAFVTWTNRTSVEVFVKVVAEEMMSGERTVCATSFVTFVSININGEKQMVPGVIPETELEKFLFEGAPERAKKRLEKREISKDLAARFGTRSF
ncbi:acyl-CoA thioesterase [Geopsychrobacter electrodiphilus]|uniref:acyl-CoA thioesterase n=1 Tax=Geopsychrobacter electrodiphilus TaxID=225196 RepID=UPI00035F5C2F|nr:acyl-CoA thioesterase [Geopsychrobacter electrodiphilus]